VAGADPFAAAIRFPISDFPASDDATWFDRPFRLAREQGPPMRREVSKRRVRWSRACVALLSGLVTAVTPVAVFGVMPVSGTPRTGPETRPRFRDWLPIIII